MVAAASRLRISGFASLLAGAVCLLFPLTAGTLLVVVGGVAVMLAGIVSLDAARRFPAGTPGRGRYVLESIGLVAAGLLLVLVPAIGMALLTWVVGLISVGVGLSRLAGAWDLRPRAGWGFVALLGVALVVFGVLVLAGGPVSGAALLGLGLGTGLVLDGLLRLTVAHGLRRAPAPPGAGAGPR